MELFFQKYLRAILDKSLMKNVKQNVLLFREITELQDKVNVQNAENKKQSQEISELKVCISLFCRLRR